jgi:hypothetical protein
MRSALICKACAAIRKRSSGEAYSRRRAQIQYTGFDLAFEVVDARTSSSREKRQLFTTALRMQLTASSVQTSLVTPSLVDGCVVLCSVLRPFIASSDWLPSKSLPPVPAPLQAAWTSHGGPGMPLVLAGKMHAKHVRQVAAAKQWTRT